MYEVDGICYAGTPINLRRITEAKPLRGGCVLVTFLSGEKRIFDTTTLDGSVFEPLSDERVLASVKVEHGFISWDDGKIDLAPEYLYEHSFPYESEESSLLAS